MSQTDDTTAINLGAALKVIRDFLDCVGRSESALRETSEYVAARCVMERLLDAKEPA